MIHAGIRYTAPNDDGRRAHVQAWATDTNNMHWKVTVFRNFMNPFAEEGVQHVYIKQMSMRDEKPVVIVEDGRVFGVDLKTRAVKRLKQAPPEESQANPVSAVNGGMPILSRSGRIRLAATDSCCSAAITHNEDDEIKHL